MRKRLSSMVSWVRGRLRRAASRAGATASPSPHK